MQPEDDFGRLQCRECGRYFRVSANWGAGPTVDWATGYTAAQAFHAEHGHLNVPAGTHIDDVDLAAWLERRRDQRRRNELAAGHLAQLEALGIDWRNRADIHRRLWDQGLAVARAWWDTSENCAVKDASPPNAPRCSSSSASTGTPTPPASNNG